MDRQCTSGPHRAIAMAARPSRSTMSSARRTHRGPRRSSGHGDGPVGTRGALAIHREPSTQGWCTSERLAGLPLAEQTELNSSMDTLGDIARTYGLSRPAARIYQSALVIDERRVRHRGDLEG